MNCKQGDIAVIVRSKLGNLGLLVEVVAPIGVHPIGTSIVVAGQSWRIDGDTYLWEVRSLGSGLMAENGMRYVVRPLPDSRLRPLRPGEEPLDEAEPASLDIRERTE